MKNKSTYWIITILLVFIGTTSKGQLIPLESALSCPPIFSDTVKVMGRAGGLTVTVEPGCSNVGWGFDLYQGIHFGYDPFNDAPLDIVECESNLNRGYIKMVGTRPMTYYDPSLNVLTEDVDLQLFVQFTRNGTDPIPLSRNGDIVYHSTELGFQVHFLLEVNVGDISNPYWHSVATHSGWSPALTVYDDLATPIAGAGLVFTGLRHDYYKLEDHTFLTGSPTIPGVTVSQNPVSLPNTLPGGFNTGIELSAYNGTSGIEYTYTNSTGSDLAVGIDPATGFGYSYESTAPPPLGDPFEDTGRILYYSKTESNIANGLIVLTGCTPIRHRMDVPGVVFQTTPSIDTRMEVQFYQGASGTTTLQPVWRQGLIYMNIANGQTARVNFVMTADADGLTATPAWNGSPQTGMTAALTLFDELQNEPTGTYSVVYQKLAVKVFDPTVNTNTATLTWTGAVSTAWENPCNWQCRVPTIYDDVIIPDAPVSGNYPLIAPTIIGDSRTIDIQGTTPIIDRLTIQTGGILNVALP